MQSIRTCHELSSSKKGSKKIWHAHIPERKQGKDVSGEHLGRRPCPSQVLEDCFRAIVVASMSSHSKQKSWAVVLHRRRMLDGGGGGVCTRKFCRKRRVLASSQPQGPRFIHDRPDFAFLAKGKPRRWCSRDLWSYGAKQVTHADLICPSQLRSGRIRRRMNGRKGEWVYFDMFTLAKQCFRFCRSCCWPEARTRMNARAGRPLRAVGVNICRNRTDECPVCEGVRRIQSSPGLKFTRNQRARIVPRMSSAASR